ncbi:MAG: PAS domain S-box protein, partial [Leptolyngbya sp. SIO4C5]|nr:PAS domain S-box protein [Leptolyngbya sp. SIO4C5]
MNSDASSRPFESYWLQIAKAVEHASDGIVIANCDRELVYINPALVNLLGYSLSDLKAVGGADAVYEDAQQLRSIRETVMQQGSWAGEALIRHRRGDRRVVFVRIDTIQSETGALVGYVALHTDITAQREAQQERNLLLQRLSAQNQNLESLIQERTRRLQQQARTLNTILESSLDHIYCVDRRCRFLYASRAGAAAMGLQPMEMIGRTPDQVKLPRQLVKQLEWQIRDIFTTQQPGIYQSTVSMVTGDRVFEYALSL